MPETTSTNQLATANRVFSATALVMLIVAIVIGYALLHQIGNYDRLLQAAAAALDSSPKVIALARSLDAAVIKTCSILMAFLLVFLGGLYTLQVGRSVYRLSVEGRGTKGALETASPGLVMLTIGALLISITIWKEYTINVDSTVLSASSPATSPDSQRVRTSSAGRDDPLAFSDDDVRALNSAWIATKTELRSARQSDRPRLGAVADRLDSLRKTIALRRYPVLQGKFAALQAMERENPSSIDALPPDERKAFQHVQLMLGEPLSAR